MASQNSAINIFPFVTSFFRDKGEFEYYFRNWLPDFLRVEHTQLRTPRIMVFAYQGDHSLWGYAEIESWEIPTERDAIIGIEWGGSKFRRVYRIKPCTIREFNKHVSFSVLHDLGFETFSIKYAPRISAELFNQVLKKAEGETNLCADRALT